MATPENPAASQTSESDQPQESLPSQLPPLDDLTPSQAQQVLESALQHYRRLEESPRVPTSSLLNGGLLTAAPTGKYLFHWDRYMAIILYIAAAYDRFSVSISRRHYAR